MAGFHGWRPMRQVVHGYLLYEFRRTKSVEFLDIDRPMTTDTVITLVEGRTLTFVSQNLAARVS